jgi:hypothetical protein
MSQGVKSSMDNDYLEPTTSKSFNPYLELEDKKKRKFPNLGPNLVLDLSKILYLILQFWLVSKLDINIRSLPIGFHTFSHTHVDMFFGSYFSRELLVLIPTFIFIFFREPLTLVQGFFFLIINPFVQFWT